MRQNLFRKTGLKPIVLKDFQSYICARIKGEKSDKDAAFAACAQKGILDISKEYDFKVLETSQSSEVLVLACEKSKVKSPAIAEFLLPLALEKSLLENAMFCLQSSLVAFHQGKILHVQKYQDFTDIFTALEHIRQTYNLEIQEIYCHQKYDSIKAEQKPLEEILPQGDSRILEQIFRQQKELFFTPIPSFTQTSFFKLATLLLALALGLQITSLVLESQMDSTPYENPLPTLTIDSSQEADRAYFSRFLLLARIFELTKTAGLFIQDIEFTSQDKNHSFSLSINACAPNHIDPNAASIDQNTATQSLLPWAQKISALLKTSKIQHKKLEPQDGVECILATWVKA